MANNKLQFPLTVRTDGEEFIINKEERKKSIVDDKNDFIKQTTLVV
jgi:hypothetical protein